MVKNKPNTTPVKKAVDKVVVKKAVDKVVEIVDEVEAIKDVNNIDEIIEDVFKIDKPAKPSKWETDIQKRLDILKEPTLTGAITTGTGQKVEEIQIVKPHIKDVHPEVPIYENPPKASFLSKHKYKLGGIFGGLAIATGLGIGAGLIGKAIHDNNEK